MTSGEEYARRKAEHLSPVGRLSEESDSADPSTGSGQSLEGIRNRLQALPGAAAGLFEQCLETDRLDVTAENSFFGEMNWREWYYFLRVHALSHLEQIEKLRSWPGFPA